MLTLVGSVAAVACTHVPPLGLKPPELRAGEVQIREISLSQVRLTLNLDAFNPNEVVLPFSHLRVDVDLFGYPFAQGTARDSYVELPPATTSSIPIEFVVPASRLKELAQNLRLVERPQFDYRLRGSAVWGTNGVQMPFERRGELPGLRRLFELLRR